MKRLNNAVLTAAAVAAAACAENPTASPDSSPSPSSSVTAATGSLYTATNGAAGNEVLSYRIEADGSLTFDGAAATGGAGTGAGLGNQGGVVLSDNGRWLFAVNAGSDEVSVFARRPDGSLTRTDVVGSGGSTPISVTQSGSLLYVLNRGGDGGIAGFRLSAHGTLSMIPGSQQGLSQAGGVDPAQIQFSNDGRWLVVTEKNTDRIVVYPVAPSGDAGTGVVNHSHGATPFGFAFDHAGRLIVSNAAGGAAGAGSVSSYAVAGDGSLHVLDAAVPNFQSASCWIAISRNGLFAYTTNAATNNTSGYHIGARGGLTLLDASGVTAMNSGGPIDAAVTHRGRQYLYVLNGAAGAIDAFEVGPDGELAPLGGGVTGLPAGTNGLAAH